MSVRNCFVLLFLTATAVTSNAFFVDPARRRTLFQPRVAATTVAEPETETRQKTNRKSSSSSRRTGMDDDGNNSNDLEYYQDPSASREMEDPFHILLMGSTFEKPKITVTYVSGSLEYVLNMPYNEAVELSQFAHDEGMSCLGTWTREECLSLGKQLQMRDIVCRVVPFTEGGQRGWQAKDASFEKSNNNNNAYFGK